MSFIVTEDCVRLGLRAGAVVFRNVHVSVASPWLRSEISAEVAKVRARFANPAAVRSAPEVNAFREILRQVGANPRKEQCSIERLLTFALKRGDLPVINSLVDAYNLVSIRWGCSLGAHDLDKIAAPVTLRLLTGSESFTPLGQASPMAAVPGEYGYVDAVDQLLCRLDVLQAEFSKVTAGTVNALLIIEGTNVHSPEVLRQAFADVIDLVTRSCGGVAEVVAFS